MDPTPSGLWMFAARTNIFPTKKLAEALPALFKTLNSSLWLWTARSRACSSLHCHVHHTFVYFMLKMLGSTKVIDSAHIVAAFSVVGPLLASNHSIYNHIMSLRKHMIPDLLMYLCIISFLHIYIYYIIYIIIYIYYKSLHTLRQSDLSCIVTGLHRSMEASAPGMHTSLSLA